MARRKKPQVHNVHPQLTALMVDVATVHLDPANMRDHGSRSIQSIADSYREHGQRKPIVVHKDSRKVLAGNGQLQAATDELGWTHIAAIFVEDTDDQATRFAMRDNRTAELSAWDIDAVAEGLQDMQSRGVDITDLGWTEVEMLPYLELDAAFDPGVPEDIAGTDFTPPDNSGKSPHRLEFTPEQWDELTRLTKPVNSSHPTMTAERVLAALV